MIYGEIPPQEYPLYSRRAVSKALRMPPSTLRLWLKLDHRKSIITISEYQSTLNFLQLSEAFAIRYMRELGISLQRIRKASEYLKKELRLDYPLINPRIHVGIKDVYYDYAKDILLNATRQGQVESFDLIGQYIHRLEFDQHNDWPNVLYPFIPGKTRKNISINPRVRFGQPTITGTGISVSAIQDRFEAGESETHIASSYGITQEKVKDAIAYATC